ncbi:MAG: hypothetical protein Q4G42_03330 [Neisseria sp.]|nr:hypothetical protein [Neisseria sp.]
MLPVIYRNEKHHMAFALLQLLLSFVLSLLAVFGAILSHINYLAFLPVGFMLFVGSLFGFLILAEENPAARKFKTYFSIETSAVLFAVLLLPLAFFFVWGITAS